METPTKKYNLTNSTDNERISFMYSPLPKDKNINPKHWESKISFWKTEIKKSCRFYRNFCFSILELKETFRDENNRIPQGLGTVVNSMYQENQILFLANFLNVFNNTWSHWGYQFASNSASWIWRKTWSGEFHDKTLFVLKDMLEEYANELLDCHYKTAKHDKTDHIVPLNVIKTLYQINGEHIKDENILLCIIGFLKNERKCLVCMSKENKKIVKFISKSQAKVEPVTDTDLEIVKLKKTIAKLSMEMKQLEVEINRLKVAAHKSLMVNNKDQAKKLLLQKWKLQKVLTFKQDAFYTLNENLRIIRDSESVKMLTDALKSSAIYLKESYKDLTVNHVEEVIDETLEVKHMINDIDETFLSGITQINDEDYDMNDLEKELENLTVDSMAPQVIDISQLPDVPATTPGKITPREERANQVTEQNVLLVAA